MYNNRIDIKIVTIGNSFVGKTSISNKYANDKKIEQYEETIACNIFPLKKEISYRGGIVPVTILLFDLPGQERFICLREPNTTNARGCILVFDVTDRKSFESLDNWYDMMVKQNINYNIKNNYNTTLSTSLPFILIGTKCDKVEKRVISKESALQWCKGKPSEIHFLETSYEDDINTLSNALDSFFYPKVIDYFYNLNSDFKSAIDKYIVSSATTNNKFSCNII